MRPTGFPLRATLVRRALVVSVAAALAFIGLPFFATAVRAADDCVGGSIYFSPHADDDLLFMSPDLLKDIRGERCVLTVYVTTGDAGMDEWYWLGRERGEEATYAHMAGQANKWTTSSIEVAGNRVRLRTLDGDPRIRLAFMRLPDGYVLGTGSERNSYQSLERMWKGEIRTMTAVDGSASYTRESFTDALVSYLVQYQPTIVRTTDFVSSYGDGDHSDHHSVGYFVRDASQRWGGPHTLLAYQGYGIANRAANVKGVDLETKRAVFDVYAGYDGLVCTGGCLGSKEDRWLQRQYILESQPFANIARGSGVTVTASSQNASTGQLASKAIDGYALGYPTDHTHEWATVGGKAGSWIQIDFDRPTTIDEVILYDRPSTVEHITGGTLSFSDGSTVDVGPLANEGSGTSVSFRTRTVTSVRLTIDSVSSSTVNIGLTEFEVHSRTMNVARTVGPVVTASSQSVSTGQTAVKVVDG
nr:hypothetical protein [Actinomycetales bacterium]